MNHLQRKVLGLEERAEVVKRGLKLEVVGGDMHKMHILVLLSSRSKYQ